MCSLTMPQQFFHPHLRKILYEKSYYDIVTIMVRYKHYNDYQYCSIELIIHNRALMKLKVNHKLNEQHDIATLFYQYTLGLHELHYNSCYHTLPSDVMVIVYVLARTHVTTTYFRICSVASYIASYLDISLVL